MRSPRETRPTILHLPQLRGECVAFCKAHPDIDRDGLIAYATALFATDAFDLRSVAIAVLERKWKLLQASDVPWLVELARTGACWAHVDFLAGAVIDPLLERDGGVATCARAWAGDDSFWVRRVALLCQLRALRRGAGDFALFAQLAAPMVTQKEFFIRKAIGWVLREVSKKRPRARAGLPPAARDDRPRRHVARGDEVPARGDAARAREGEPRSQPYSVIIPPGARSTT